MKSFVFNGWAIRPEVWKGCAFPHDRLFDYIEQLDGLPERAMAGTDAAVLVGFSMGGSTALRMLLRFPEKVKGLVLVSTTPRMMESLSEPEPWRGMSERRSEALRYGTLLQSRGSDDPLFAESNLDRGLDYLRKTDLRADLIALAGQRDLAALPVAIFQAEKDGIVRPQNAQFLKRVFPQAQVTLVPGSEHVLPLTVPDLIDRAVREIFSSNHPGAKMIQSQPCGRSSISHDSVLPSAEVNISSSRRFGNCRRNMR